MSDEKPTETAPKSKSSPLALVLPAVLAAAAAFAGAKFAGPHVAHAAESPKAEVKPPGPTMQLEPFLVTIADGARHQHTMKVSLAIELESSTKEESVKSFIPRARDACLSYLRVEVFEQVTEPEHASKLRQELTNRLKEAGVPNVERVLITDLVVQ